MADLFIKSLIVGILSSIFIMGLILFTLNTDYFGDSLTWTALVISISAGIIITLIVDKRASDAHENVLQSQKEIQNLLKQLDETDRKHNEVLTQLNESRTRNENLAKNSIVTSSNYVKSMLVRLISSLDEQTLGKKQMNLIVNVLNHLESPLNLIEQAIPQSSKEFRIYESDIKDITQILRKLIIASVVVTDAEVIKTFELIKKSNEKLEGLLKKIN